MSAQDADLTFKSHRDGGRRIVEKGRATQDWYLADAAISQFLVLVHGFRTDEAHASDNYEIFRENLRKIDRNLGKTVRTMSWPSRGRALDFVRYFAAVDEVAQKVGLEFSDYLRRELRSNHRDYVFVAHSLGCRLMLEMVRDLYFRDPKFLKRIRVVLMAPAVRVEDFAPTSDKRYRKCVAALQDSLVLFSPDDTVLRRWFVRGMRPRSKEAVGLLGVPRDAWAQRPQQMRAFAHDDYWQDKNRSATEAVAAFLKVARRGPLSSAPVNPGNPLPGPTIGSRAA